MLVDVSAVWVSRKTEFGLWSIAINKKLEDHYWATSSACQVFTINAMCQDESPKLDVDRQINENSTKCYYTSVVIIIRFKTED